MNSFNLQFLNIMVKNIINRVQNTIGTADFPNIYWDTYFKVKKLTF